MWQSFPGNCEQRAPRSYPEAIGESGRRLRTRRALLGIERKQSFRRGKPHNGGRSCKYDHTMIAQHGLDLLERVGGRFLRKPYGPVQIENALWQLIC
jgi:hypothetical protein